MKTKAKTLFRVSMAVNKDEHVSDDDMSDPHFYVLSRVVRAVNEGEAKEKAVADERAEYELRGLPWYGVRRMLVGTWSNNADEGRVV